MQYSEPSVCGPANPTEQTGEKVLLTESAEGSRITVHTYKDGSIYEASVPKGGDLAVLTLQLSKIPSGRMMSMYDPADTGDMETEFFYLAVWVPHPRDGKETT